MSTTLVVVDIGHHSYGTVDITKIGYTEVCL